MSEYYEQAQTPVTLYGHKFKVLLDDLDVTQAFKYHLQEDLIKAPIRYFSTGFGPGLPLPAINFYICTPYKFGI